MNKCPCGSNRDFTLCCKPFIDGNTHPKTCLELMRSRYTAYSLANIDYIVNTMCGEAIKGFEKEQALSWAKNCHWQSLEIINFSADTVEFKANFIQNTKLEVLHENSQFKLIEGKWFYIGMVKKPTKNQPCPCNSGKKYKRCCGAKN